MFNNNTINYNNITFSIIKPDAMIKNQASAINSLLEKNGFKIILQEIRHISLENAQDFYAEHKERPFFGSLTKFLSSGPITVQVLYHPEGNTVKKYRDIMGATNPQEASEGTIRSLYGHSLDYNAAHGSDSEISSAREIHFFFPTYKVFQALRDLNISVNDIIMNK